MIAINNDHEKASNDSEVENPIFTREERAFIDWSLKQVQQQRIDSLEAIYYGKQWPKDAPRVDKEFADRHVGRMINALTTVGFLSEVQAQAMQQIKSMQASGHNRIANVAPQQVVPPAVANRMGNQVADTSVQSSGTASNPSPAASRFEPSMN